MQKALSSSESIIDVGAAGTTMRFLTAYFASKEGEERLLTGSERMLQRPIADLVEALQALGADIVYEGNVGCPPLRIRGKKLKGGKVHVHAGLSSQFASALLLIAPLLEEGLQLQLGGNVVSESYIQMTLSLMRHFGIESTHCGTEIKVDPQAYQARNYVVESDWSAASYYYALAALAPQAHICLHGLNPPFEKKVLQGDTAIAHLARHLGVETYWDKEGQCETNIPLICLKKNAFNTIQHTALTEFDFTNCPDIAQTAAVMYAALQLPLKMYGLQTLQAKETDRTAAIAQELAKINAVFEELPIHGLPPNHTFVLQKNENLLLTDTYIPTFNTYDDHRMAMSFAALAMVYRQGVRIENPQVVSKSYPRFWDDLQKLGMKIRD